MTLTDEECQCRAFNEVTELACAGDARPKFVFANIGESKEDPIVDHRPDVAMYSTARNSWQYSVGEKERSKLSHERLSHAAHTRFADMEMLIEAKWNSAGGYSFEAGAPLFPKTVTKSPNNQARAQHVKHVAEVFRHQHRHHLFTMYVRKRKARIFYWDRAGVVVSEILDLADDDGARRLLNFVYRIVDMDDNGRGHDLSVTRVEGTELDKACKYRSQNATAQKYWDDVLKAMNTGLFPMYKVCAHNPSLHVAMESQLVRLGEMSGYIW